MVQPGVRDLARIQQKLRMWRFMSMLENVKSLRSVDTDAGRHDVAIGFLTCSRHVSLMLLAAKSFYHFSGIICPLYVWDDGSLRSRDRDSIRRLFPAAHILRRTELNLNMLSPYPLTYSFAQQRLKNYEAYAPSLKIFGPLASPDPPDHFILSDSDAFFFDWPLAIIDWLDDNQSVNRYIAPVSGQDNVPEKELQDLCSLLGVISCPRINSGLLLLHRSIFKLDILEKILEWYQSRPPVWDIEQTIYRLLMACSNSVHLNQDDYVLCLRKYNAVCHHFFTSVIHDEHVARWKILNLLAYINDSERREKPPIVIAQQLMYKRLVDTRYEKRTHALGT